jgi:tripartite-type tricarboxylate transporter receptor subunit TctC
MTSTRLLTALLLTAAVCQAAASAHAYPSKPIKMIVPYTPGSPLDALARLVMPSVSPRFGQSIVMDNRLGAGTTIGIKAAADLVAAIARLGFEPQILLVEDYCTFLADEMRRLPPIVRASGIRPE